MNGPDSFILHKMQYDKLNEELTTHGPYWLMGYAIAQSNLVDMLRRDWENSLLRTKDYYRQYTDTITQACTRHVVDFLVEPEERVAFLAGYDEAMKQFRVVC